MTAPAVRVIAVLSMLHEPQAGSAAGNSATRAFLGRPVLANTLERLTRCQTLSAAAVVCWADQAEAVRGIAGPATHDAGPRRASPDLVAVSAARRWADGWRGGLLSTAECDLGFDGPRFLDLAERATADAVVLVDPSAVLLDPRIVDAVVDRAERIEGEFAFSPAAPGLGVMLIKVPLLRRLAAARVFPGRVLTYQPEAPLRDPLGAPGCVDPPLAAARTTARFTASGAFATARLEQACRDAGGVERITTELLVSAVERLPVARLPRDVTLELTTRRATHPIYSPRRAGPIERPDVTVEAASALFAALAGRDDVRLTLAGVGDPLLHSGLPQIVAAARDAGISAIHVETDLLADPSAVDALAGLPVDVVSVHVPAVSAATYAAVMGVDGLTEAVRNVERLLARRRDLAGGTPVLAPTFTKCAANVAEMEAWYDGWLRVAGSAVIAPPPGDFGGRIEDVSVGDMSPARRVPCRRLVARMTVLSDGTIVACEQDVTGLQPMGRANDVATAWNESFGRLRALHADRRWGTCAPCAGCREWHRP